MNMEENRTSKPLGGNISRRDILKSGAAMLGAGWLGSMVNPAEVATSEELRREIHRAARRVPRNDIIRAENAKPGTTDWILTKVKRHENEPYDLGWHRRKEIEGFVSHLSIKAGEELKIYVSTDPPDNYQIQIFRMGYYGGKGARLMMTMNPITGLAPGKPQPTPEDGEHNIQECQWEVAATITIPDDWVSGVYLGKLSTWRATESEAYFIFVVRDDRPADILFQVSDFTWQAYNRWPQWRSMYDGPAGPWQSRKPDSYSAGFDRPYAIYWNGYPAAFEPLTNGSGTFLMTEYPLAYFLEKEGYDVTYISNLDTHEDLAGLLRGKVWLSVGHDEYWTKQLNDNIIKARDAGLSLAFFSGNAVSGRIELLTSSDGRPNRGIRSIPGGLDDIEIMGAKSYGVGLGDWTCAEPDHWVFEGTGMKKGDFIPNLIGWEFHGYPVAEQHKDLVVLAEGPVRRYEGQPMERRHAATIYTAPKGNLVFNAGTCWWNKVLSTPPAYINPPFLDFSQGDERVRQITRNVLDRMISVKIE